MLILMRHVYRLWKTSPSLSISNILILFSPFFLWCSLCPQSLETLHAKPPALSLGSDKMQSGSNVNWTHSSGSFFTVKFRLLFNMNPPYELTGVFRKMTLPGMMALLPLEHTSPFIPLGGKCFRDIFNLSPFHHTFHPSDVLWAEYPQILFSRIPTLCLCAAVCKCIQIYTVVCDLCTYFWFMNKLFLFVYMSVQSFSSL